MYHSNDFKPNYIFEDEFFSNYGVTIYHQGQGDSINIRGVLLNQTSITFANQYTGAVSLAKMAIDKGMERLGGSAGMDIKAALLGSATSVQDTIRKYQGPNLPGITIDLLLMKEFMPDYAKCIKDSIKLSNPHEFTAARTVGAPNDMYEKATLLNPQDAIDASNTCSVIIGKSLNLNFMLCDSFTYTQSAQKREDGEPMYVKATYSFGAGRAVTAAEVTKWFLTL